MLYSVWHATDGVHDTAADELPLDPQAPRTSPPPEQRLAEAELEALEDAEDVRISLERLKSEDSVPWESIKARHGL